MSQLAYALCKLHIAAEGTRRRTTDEHRPQESGVIERRRKRLAPSNQGRGASLVCQILSLCPHSEEAGLILSITVQLHTHQANIRADLRLPGEAAVVVTRPAGQQAAPGDRHLPGDGHLFYNQAVAQHLAGGQVGAGQE